MSERVISIENVSKKFIISHEAPERYTALRDVVANKLSSVFSFSKGKKSDDYQKREEFWALKDINFNINQGDRLGIIGRNGAGKSTLLKVISRITDPSAGKIKIRGRIASLLEVGTGFHPELTGRENIYLNGAILGMKRFEIRQKFDEIVEFAEVSKFLDTPVKRYSSGMYVRLAFGVAAHLEPEILIVDEVLAVGDAQFQRKCLGKMEDVSKNKGRTVLFVSHNMAAIRSLCNKGVYLNAGKVLLEDSIENCIDLYEQTSSMNESPIWMNDESKIYDPSLESISVLDKDLNLRKNFLNSEMIIVRIVFSSKRSTKNVKAGFDLICKGAVVFRTQQIDTIDFDETEPGKRYILDCEIPKWLLNIGEYFIRPLFSIHMVKPLTKMGDVVISFNVSLDSSKTIYHTTLKEGNNPGLVFPQLKWKYDAINF